MASNIFNTVKMSKPETNVFDMSYDMKLSLNMGELIPIHTMEVVPGDKISMNTESLLRFAPMIAPVMHKVDVYTHSFFVPNRLLWANWEKFITGGQPGDIPPAAPFFENGTAQVGTLADYIGLPTGVQLTKYSCMPFAAYQLIYNEYYRDQNLQIPQNVALLDGSNNSIAGQLATLQKRAWQHDYFTASLPFAQKGDAVDIPLTGEIPIKVNTFGSAYTADTDAIIPGTYMPSVSPSNLGVGAENLGSASIPGGYLYADGDGAVGGTTINELRKAFRLQEWLEKNARGGTRYIESILVHFGIKSSDARLQRPEYLGGSKQPMIISEVLQTSESATTPQGTMGGHGVSVGNGKTFNYSCEEHGYIMTILSVMPKTAYQQGLHKSFSRFDKLDYLWPTFAHLGEQEVLKKELFVSSANADGQNEQTFGYVPRYAEYRYLDSRVAGEFRTTLAFWHLGRIFSTRPQLNSDFIKCDPSHRIFAVTAPEVDKIYAHCFHQIKAVRKLPKYGTPTF